jgi:hypothetical protein
MTVKELKNKLKDIPEDTEVFVATDDNDGFAIEVNANIVSYNEDINVVYIG